MGNLRVETLAVSECQKGNIAPLFELLEPLQSSYFALLLCLEVKQGGPVKITRRNRIGYLVDSMLRKRPGEKKQICDELAKQFKLSEHTVRHYHEHWLKSTKPNRRDLDEIRQALGYR